MDNSLPSAVSPQLTGDIANLIPATGVENQSVVETPQNVEPLSGVESPQSQSQESPPAEDYRNLYETTRQEQAAITAENNKYKQAFDELRQLQQAAVREQREAQLTQAAQSRIDQVYTQAQNMQPEDAFSYIRRMEDQERAQLRSQIDQERQQGQQQVWQTARQLASPLYAQKLVADNKLPPEYVQHLSVMAPEQMDAALPYIINQYQAVQKQSQQYQDLMKEVSQLKRSEQAAQIVATGAHNVTESGFAPQSGTQGQAKAGSREHLLELIGPLFNR